MKQLFMGTIIHNKIPNVLENDYASRFKSYLETFNILFSTLLRQMQNIRTFGE